MEEAQNNPETTCTGVREHLHRTSSKKPNTRSHLAVRGRDYEIYSLLIGLIATHRCSPSDRLNEYFV